jgi:hypothetical protein
MNILMLAFRTDRATPIHGAYSRWSTGDSLMFSDFITINAKVAVFNIPILARVATLTISYRKIIAKSSARVVSDHNYCNRHDWSDDFILV